MLRRRRLLDRERKKDKNYNSPPVRKRRKARIGPVLKIVLWGTKRAGVKGGGRE